MTIPKLMFLEQANEVATTQLMDEVATTVRRLTVVAERLTKAAASGEIAAIADPLTYCFLDLNELQKIARDVLTMTKAIKFLKET